MTDINSVALVGRLSKDATIRTTKSGKSIASFSLAVNRSVKDQQGNWTDSASFIDVRYWLGNGGLAQYLLKGKQVGVSGEIVQEKWQANDGSNRYSTYVLAHSVQLLTPKENNNQQVQKNQPAGDWQTNESGPEGFNDDIPF